MKLYETVKKLPSQVTQDEWDSGDYYLVPKDFYDPAPVPYDADIIIKDGSLVLEGSINGGPFNTKSNYCKVVISNDIADKFYEVVEV